MEVTTIKSQIQKNELDPFYIFTGPEIAVMDIYIKQIAKVRNLSLERRDQVTEIFHTMKSKTLVSTNHCYIVRDDKEFMSTEQLWSTIEDKIGNNVLIFIVTNVDKRSKFYKQYKERIVEFEYLKTDVLKRYVQNKVDLNDRNCEILIDICENDYSRILLEIDKIQRYNDKDPNKSFITLLQDGVIYVPPTDAIFELVDAIMKHKPKKCFDLLQECYEYGENTLTIISVLYTNIKQVLQVQTCESKDISKSTGLTGYQVKLAKEKCGVYSTEHLAYMLKLVRKVERGIKCGTMEDSMAVPYILVNMM